MDLEQHISAALDAPGASARDIMPCARPLTPSVAPLVSRKRSVGAFKRERSAHPSGPQRGSTQRTSGERGDALARRGFPAGGV